MANFGLGNLAGANLTKVLLYSAFTSTVNSSITPSGTIQNFTADSTPNSYIADNVAPTKQRRFSAFTTTLKVSWVHSTGSAQGITIGANDTNSFYDNAAADKIHYHSGFTSTITSSTVFTGKSHWDISHDGTNILGVELVNLRYTRYSAFTSTVKSSFSLSAIVTPRGGTWDGTNNIVSDGSAPTQSYKRYSAFTTTIKSSFATAGVQHGSEWDRTTDRFPAAGGGAVVLYPTLLLMNAG